MVCVCVYAWEWVCMWACVFARVYVWVWIVWVCICAYACMYEMCQILSEGWGGWCEGECDNQVCVCVWMGAVVIHLKNRIRHLHARQAHLPRNRLCMQLWRDGRATFYGSECRYRRTKMWNVRDTQVWQSYAHAPKNDRNSTMSTTSKIICNFLDVYWVRHLLAKTPHQTDRGWVFDS